MRGMDMGPGTGLGGLGWFLGIWVTMMAAMMLPSALPMVLLFGRVASGHSGSRGTLASTVVFVSGYLGAWAAFGLAAFGLGRLLRGREAGLLSRAGQGPMGAGSALLAAGAYHLTPLNRL